MTTFTSWDTELYHFGTRGMKWGIRRYQNEDGSLTEAGKRRYGSVENFNRQQLMKKKARNMTDDELKQVIARKELEAKYRESTRSPLAKSAENLFNKISESREKAAARKEREEDRRIRTLESINSVKRAKEQTAQEKARAQQKKSESVIANSKSKINESKAALRKAKNERKAQKFWNHFLSMKEAKQKHLYSKSEAKDKLDQASWDSIKQEKLSAIARHVADQKMYSAQEAMYKAGAGPVNINEERKHGK